MSVSEASCPATSAYSLLWCSFDLCFASRVLYCASVWSSESHCSHLKPQGLLCFRANLFAANLTSFGVFDWLIELVRPHPGFNSGHFFFALHGYLSWHQFWIWRYFHSPIALLIDLQDCCASDREPRQRKVAWPWNWSGLHYAFSYLVRMILAGLWLHCCFDNVLRFIQELFLYCCHQ